MLQLMKIVVVPCYHYFTHIGGKKKTTQKMRNFSFR